MTRLHDRALREVTRRKKEARQALQKARRSGEVGATIQSLSGKLGNRYLNPGLQKAFLLLTPGVSEHQAKLAAVIWTSKQRDRSLAIFWLGIAIAYGSVHHFFIDFSLPRSSRVQ